MKTMSDIIKLPKPKFYKSELVEIHNVLGEVYPHQKEPPTMTERMGSEDAKCPECSNNEWWLLPADSVAVREGGKPYIECLNCGYHTHL
jgi:Zn ribbon nucleic-acid-binding protein